jgi:hypothetical protein
METHELKVSMMGCARCLVSLHCRSLGVKYVAMCQKLRPFLYFLCFHRKKRLGWGEHRKHMLAGLSLFAPKDKICPLLHLAFLPSSILE